MQKNGFRKTVTVFSLGVSFLCIFTGCTKDPKVAVTADQTIADKFERYTVTGIRTPLPQLPDVPGFVGASYLTIGDIDGDGMAGYPLHIRGRAG